MSSLRLVQKIMLRLLKLLRTIILLPIAIIISIIVTIISMVLSPILIVLLVLNVFPYYIFISILSKLVYPDAIRILRGADNVMAKGCVYSSSSNYVSVIQVYAGRLEYEKLLGEIEERVVNRKQKGGSLQFPELKYYIQTFMGYSFFRPDNSFDSKNHVRVYENARNENIDKKKLHKIREEEITRLFSQKRSPWEVVLVNNYRKLEQGKEKEYSVLIWKIHHCMGDATAAIQIQYGSFGEFPKLRTPQFGNTFAKKFIVSLSAYANFLIFCANVPFDIIYNPARIFDYNSWHKFIKVKDLKTVLWSPEPVDADLVKEISSANKISITAVLMTTCIGAFRRMMEAKGVKTPKTIRCWFSYNLPYPEDAATLTNNSMINYFRIPISSYKDPVELSKNINKSLATAVVVGHKVMSHIMKIMCKYLPISFDFNKLIQNNYYSTIGFSSCPMPSIDVQMADCRLEESYSNVDMSDTASSMVPYCVKYKDKFFITFALQRTLLKNDEEIYDIEKYFLEEFNLMKANSLTV